MGRLLSGIIWASRSRASRCRFVSPNGCSPFHNPGHIPGVSESGSLRAPWFLGGANSFSGETGGRESIEYDVVIVGAGPAGLSAAIRLKQLCRERDFDLLVCVVEKGAQVGAHVLSGNVFEPRALNELLPDWRNEEAPVDVPVSSDKFWYLTKDRAISLPCPFENSGNYVISMSHLTRWMGVKAEELGVEIYPGFAAGEMISKFESVRDRACESGSNSGDGQRGDSQWRPARGGSNGGAHGKAGDVMRRRRRDHGKAARWFVDSSGQRRQQAGIATRRCSGRRRRADNGSDARRCCGQVLAWAEQRLRGQRMVADTVGRLQARRLRVAASERQGRQLIRGSGERSSSFSGGYWWWLTGGSTGGGSDTAAQQLRRGVNGDGAASRRQLQAGTATAHDWAAAVAGERRFDNRLGRPALQEAAAVRHGGGYRRGGAATPRGGRDSDQRAAAWLQATRGGATGAVLRRGAHGTNGTPVSSFLFSLARVFFSQIQI